MKKAKNLVEEMGRNYFKCKECLSHGTIKDILIASCPVCGSRHLTFYKSEAAAYGKVDG